MKPWERNRGNAYEHSFQEQLANLGICQEDFDAIAPYIDEAVCGSSDTKLDSEFPPGPDGRRMILTEAWQGVPRLRIAFRVDQSGKIIYYAVDLRQ